MFSSNQILEVSGDLRLNLDLEYAVRFAMVKAGMLTDITSNEFRIYNKPIYQITNDGKFCLGVCYKMVPKGWKAFEFEVDVNVIISIIRAHLLKDSANCTFVSHDGTESDGFLMKAIPECLGEELDGILNPFYGIVTFEKFTCFYSK